MARAGSIPADIVDFLRNRPAGATIGEIATGLSEVRRFNAPRHSIRSALYQHLGTRGEGLFKRVGRGRYALGK